MIRIWCVHVHVCVSVCAHQELSQYLSSDDRNFRDRRLSIGIQKLSPLADDASVLLVSAWGRGGAK